MAYSRKQKSRSHRLSHRRSKTYKQSHSRSKRRLQKGGKMILSPSLLSNPSNSNPSNSHFSGIGFTDPAGAKTGCTGSTSSPAALKGADIYTTIGGIKMPVTMKGGARRSCAKCNRRKCACKKMKRTQRGGNTNGYSIGGIHLKPSLSGIATNYHTAYDSCKG
jgi:hypothetical protein